MCQYCQYVVRDCRTLPAPRIPTSVVRKAITHVQIANCSKRCVGMSNYTTKHLATKSHVDVASATRAGGRVGDEAASLVVRVHFR